MRVAIGRSWTRKRSAIVRQALERVVVVEGDRLVGDVAARQHERHAGVGGEQLVQRRVGEHDPEVGRARRDGRRDGGVRAGGGRARSGARASAAAPPRRAPSSTSARAAVDVGDEQRERPVLAVLAARAARATAVLVVGAAGEVVAAEALDREDPAVEQVLRRRRARDRRASTGDAVALEQPHPRARRPGRRWAARGSGGRAGRRTRPGRRRT